MSDCSRAIPGDSYGSVESNGGDAEFGRIGCCIGGSTRHFGCAADGGLFSSHACASECGTEVGPGERVVATSPKLCGFGHEDAAKHVMVSIITPDMFPHEKHPLEGIKEEQAAGLGDDAHYMTTPGFGTGLSVLKGSFAFKVRVYGFPIEQIKDKEKILAQGILAKL